MSKWQIAFLSIMKLNRYCVRYSIAMILESTTNLDYNQILMEKDGVSYPAHVYWWS